MNNGGRWYWMPGRQWAPAWVSWSVGPGLHRLVAARQSRTGRCGLGHVVAAARRLSRRHARSVARVDGGAIGSLRAARPHERVRRRSAHARQPVGVRLAARRSACPVRPPGAVATAVARYAVWRCARRLLRRLRLAGHGGPTAPPGRRPDARRSDRHPAYRRPDAATGSSRTRAARPSSPRQRQRAPADARRGAGRRTDGGPPPPAARAASARRRGRRPPLAAGGANRAARTAATGPRAASREAPRRHGRTGPPPAAEPYPGRRRPVNTGAGDEAQGRGGNQSRKEGRSMPCLAASPFVFCFAVSPARFPCSLDRTIAPWPPTSSGSRARRPSSCCSC